MIFRFWRGLALIRSYVKFLKWRLILHNDLVAAGIEADRSRGL